MYAVEIVSDFGALVKVAVERFIELSKDAIRRRGVFRVALAGGSTPRGMYARLAQPEIAERIDWLRVQLMWGDERCVAPDHPDSNFYMVKETLLDHVHIASENVYRIQGELEPEQAASGYEEVLHGAFGDNLSGTHVGGNRLTPRFDLILLGMGEDGHTASLFPNTAAIHESQRWVIAHYVEKFSAWRVTLTPIMLNAAENVIFLVSGANKAARLAEVLEGPFRPDELPAQIVRPVEGRLRWLIDEEAARQLNRQ